MAKSAFFSLSAPNPELLKFGILAPISKHQKCFFYGTDVGREWVKPISAKSKQADLSGNQRLFNLNHVSLLTPFRDPVITYSGFDSTYIWT